MIVMKVNGDSALSMAKAQTCLKTETLTPENIRRVSLMEKGSTPGATAPSMLENFHRVLSTAKAGGRVQKGHSLVTSMKVTILTTRNTDTACSPGRVATHIKESIERTSATDMVR